MTDSIDQLGRTLKPRPPNRWLRPIVRWLVAGLLLSLVPLLCRLGWFWYLSEPRRQIEIGRATTYLDGPLTPDGYVDYVAAVNSQLSEGVTPENNAVVSLALATGPGKTSDKFEREFFERLGVPAPPSNGKYFVTLSDFMQQQSADGKRDWAGEQRLEEQRKTASRRPWTRNEFPDLAALLDLNAEPLALYAEASQRERYYSPLIAGHELARMITVILPIEEQQVYGARQLAARAMLKLEEENLLAAWEDQQVIRRQSRLTGQSPFFMGLLVAIGIDEYAFTGGQAVIDSPQLTAKQARTCLRDLQSLRPWRTTAETLDKFERLTSLDMLIGIARSPGGEPGFGPPEKRLPIVNGAINWNVPLRMMNAEYDAMAEALRLPDEEAQHAFFVEQHARLQPQATSSLTLLMKSSIGQREAASRSMGELLVSTILPSVLGARNTEFRGLARDRVLQVGFALAAYRREHGTLPESLAILVPDLLPEMPLDPWTGQPLTYVRTGDGVLVYSIDLDRRDDGGLPEDPDAGRPQGDIVIHVAAE
ncbi:MAG: hypothetical protein JNG89_09130 [Planctomycetaceae bacterium]|nr:hypothetical protein [Planctomycetaceae bacterium]